MFNGWLIFLIGLFAGYAAIGAQSAQKIVTKANQGQKIALVNTSQYKTAKLLMNQQENPFSGSVEVSRSSSLYDLKNGEKYDGMDYLVAVNYLLSTGRLSTKLSYTHDLSDQVGENSTVNDSNLTYSHASENLVKDQDFIVIDWSPSVTAIVPISERSVKVEQLQSALIGSAQLKILFGERSAASGLGLSLAISAGQNFHKFETDKDGNDLNRNSSNQSIALFYSRGDFTLTASYANKIRWTYRGDQRNSFELSQDLTYSFFQPWSASIGHTNSGSSLKPNGYDSNVSLVDDDNSIVYLGLAYSI